MPPDRDHELRLAALDKARILSNAFNDIVPLQVLREGFEYRGQRVSFGSFQKGIHRSRLQQGPAALTLTTSSSGPYEDVLDPDARSILYHYRAGPIDQPDNRALRAAFEIQAPLVYFLGIDPGQYQIVFPVFVTDDDPAARSVVMEVGLPVRDTTGQGLQTPEDTRRYKLAQVARRYHQAQFRRVVLRAYRNRCAVCALRERELVEASHSLHSAGRRRRRVAGRREWDRAVRDPSPCLRPESHGDRSWRSRAHRASALGGRGRSDARPGAAELPRSVNLAPLPFRRATGPGETGDSLRRVRAGSRLRRQIGHLRRFLSNCRTKLDADGRRRWEVPPRGAHLPS